MTPCAERLCFAAAVLASTLALPCLTALELPTPLLCRASVRGSAEPARWPAALGGRGVPAYAARARGR